MSVMTNFKDQGKVGKVQDLYEPVRGKTNNLSFQPGPTQTGLYNHKRRL